MSKVFIFVTCLISILVIGGTSLLAGNVSKQSKDVPFYMWPRQKSVNLPNKLEQFVFAMLPNPKTAEDKIVTVKMTIPNGIKLINLPTGAPPTLPEKLASVVPTKYQQNGNIITVEIPAKSWGDSDFRYLTMTWNVNCDDKTGSIKFQYYIDNKLTREASLAVKIYPELSSKQPTFATLAAYNYPGLDAKYLPTFMNMMKSAGINGLYNMRGEKPNLKTSADFVDEYQINAGLVFFIHHIRDEYKLGPLSELLDNPEEFKSYIKKFFDKKFDNKKYSCVIYDAEAGGLRKGKIIGDTSEHAIEVFKKYANIPAETKLTVADIRKSYTQEWVNYICEQSNRFSRLVREVLDENYPEIRYEGYSGYELDNGPMKNRTRELYGTDWKTMSQTGIEYATAGYMGTMEDIRHTAKSVEGNAIYLPAEYYFENFNTKIIKDISPEKWGIRLINAYMNGHRHGVTLWYANVMDGNALIAIDRLASFINVVEDFAMQGELDNDAVRVTPVMEKDNVFVLRNGGSTQIIVLNPSGNNKTIRIILKNFQLSGFTGETFMIDAVTQQKIKASKVLPIRVAPYSYRVIQILEDGN